jgi:hypothetical protein
MEFYMQVVVLLFLLGCAWFDRKNKEVPDMLVSLLWVSMCIIENDLTAYQISIFAFTFLYTSNTLVNAKFGKPYLGWADILIIPVLAVLFYDLEMIKAGAWVLGLFGASIPFLISAARGKMEVAAVPCYAAAYTAGLLFVYL